MVSFAALTTNPKISVAYSNKGLFLTYVYAGRGQATALLHGSSHFRTQAEGAFLMWNIPILGAEKNKKVETHMYKHGICSQLISQNMKHDQGQSQ